jgi:hypothetical protein
MAECCSLIPLPDSFSPIQINLSKIGTTQLCTWHKNAYCGFTLDGTFVFAYSATDAQIPNDLGPLDDNDLTRWINHFG